jgi:hypothetical protein
MKTQAGLVACPACTQESNGGDYCYACGEHLHPQRASLKQIALSIPDTFFDIDNGLFFTIRSLTVNPATTLRKYFNGDRSRHMDPLKFLLYMSAIYALLYFYFDIQSPTGLYEGMADTANEKFMNEQFIKCQSFINVFSLPFLSLCTWLIFKKSGMYYGEHFLLNAYLVGLALFFQILLFPISLLGNGTAWVDAMDNVSMIVVLTWCTITYYGLFFTPSTKNMVVAAAKTFAIVFLLAIFQFITSPFVITLKLKIFGD